MWTKHIKIITYYSFGFILNKMGSHQRDLSNRVASFVRFNRIAGGLVGVQDGSRLGGC